MLKSIGYIVNEGSKVMCVTKLVLKESTKESKFLLEKNWRVKQLLGQIRHII